MIVVERIYDRVLDLKKYIQKYFLKVFSFPVGLQWYFPCNFKGVKVTNFKIDCQIKVVMSYVKVS